VRRSERKGVPLFEQLGHVGRNKPMPAKVDDLFKEIKKDNPSYDDTQAWATAWSIVCKNGLPGSDSCSKPPSEYLTGKSASRVIARFLAV